MKTKKLQSKIFKEKLEKFDYRILTDNSYTEIVNKEIKGKHGIYVLYNKEGDIHYIGKTSVIKQRLNRHINDRHKKKWVRFSVFLTKTKRHLDDLEDAFISIAGPKGNDQNRRIIPSMRQRITKAMKKNIDEMSGEKSSKRNTTKQRRKKAVKKRRSSKNHSVNPFKKRVILRKTYKGIKYEAIWLKSGKAKYKGKEYNSPYAIAQVIVEKVSKRQTVWAQRFWRVKKGNKWVRLCDL